MKRYLFSVICGGLFALFGHPFLNCAQGLAPRQVIQAGSPADVVQSYWKASLDGDHDKVISVLRFAPGIYYACLYSTPSGCDAQLAKDKKEDDAMAAAGVRTVTIDWDSPTLPSNQILLEDLGDRSPKAIREVQQTAEVVREWIHGDQARVRVRLHRGTESHEQDVLLFKDEKGWRIFEIVVIDEQPAFGRME